MARKAKYILPDGLKFCPMCQQTKSIRDFVGGYCSDCAAIYHWNYRNAPVWSELRLLLLEAVEHYGICACDEGDVAVLEVTPAKRSQIMTLTELKAQGFPPGYKMVCLNCQMKQRRGGLPG